MRLREALNHPGDDDYDRLIRKAAQQLLDLKYNPEKWEYRCQFVSGATLWAEVRGVHDRVPHTVLVRPDGSIV